MPAMVGTITKDGNVFIIRMYENIRDVGGVTPVDVWELSEVIVDEETLAYLKRRKR